VACELLPKDFHTGPPSAPCGSVSKQVCDYITSQINGKGSGDFHAHDASCAVAKAGKTTASQQDGTFKKDLQVNADQIDVEERIPQSVMDGLGRLGVLGMTVPKEFGGGGLTAENQVGADRSFRSPPSDTGGEA